MINSSNLQNRITDVFFNINQAVQKAGKKFNDITIFNNTDVTIHKKTENDIDLYVRRSFAKHLWDWLKDSASLV